MEWLRRFLEQVGKNRTTRTPFYLLTALWHGFYLILNGIILDGLAFVLSRTDD